MEFLSFVFVFVFGVMMFWCFVFVLLIFIFCRISPDPTPRSLLEQLSVEVKSMDMRKDHTLLPPWKESELNLAFPIKTGKKESDKDLREKEK